MSPSQLIGYSILHCTAITSIVSTSRVYNGLRPSDDILPSTSDDILPSINYFELPGGDARYGIETRTFTINCRAETPEAAQSIAREVGKLFGGTSFTGIYGVQNGFDVDRAAVRQWQGIIPEDDGSTSCYNAPVDIQIVFKSSTAS